MASLTSLIRVIVDRGSDEAVIDRLIAEDDIFWQANWVKTVLYRNQLRQEFIIPPGGLAAQPD